ncbi:hypothetical protein CDN99_05840 [Roseateles aquatilis]|uniref:Polymerase nucleotidyl transferase domain-containing protein n=1 Tax=Roseateles aquatilis TaxID=431061 RepID=A0A246JI29_9BURK|nr:nucleotidyltransferase domain-containing protein [Roseateles aquatilis]OWQ91889.1 hypothetical protein CDN99_05840 [Roseateles aquatilis]
MNETRPVPGDAQRRFAASAIARLSADPRIVGIAATGSWADGTLDEFSDLDLLIAVEPAAFEEILEARMAIASTLGPMLSAFTGEHVGEPRLLICLFDAPLLHVDLKFVAVDGIGAVVGAAEPLWARDGRFAPALRAVAGARVSAPNPQWIEDRFWVWVHYGATKIARGELFEALDFLSFLRTTVLAPMARAREGRHAIGLRRLEQRSPDIAAAMRPTVAMHELASCHAATMACVQLYRVLREDSVLRRRAAEDAAVTYLQGLAP